MSERFARIRALLGGAEYAPLFREVRRRVEEAGDDARSVTVRDASEDELQAIADLHGWREIRRRPTVRLHALDEALRASRVESGLHEVLEALGGPLIDRRAVRESAEAARGRIWDEAFRHPAVAGRPELEAWLTELRRLGLVVRAAGASGSSEATALRLALAAVARLPSSGVALSVLASEVAGDAHALDPGRPLGSLVLRAAAHLAGWSELPDSAAARRMLWSEVGIACDSLSVQVLVLGLRIAGADRLGRRLRDAADHGEPQRLTLREITGHALALDGVGDVFVCENPSVVAAAADRLASQSAPLVCVEGVPSTAALVLLRALGSQGARLRFRADFDWAGVRIGNRLAQEPGAVPWRFTANDYLGALERVAQPIALEGGPAPASWDPALAATMEERGGAVFEEQLVELLLNDLSYGV